MKERARRSYLKHREKVLQRSRDRYYADPEKKHAQGKIWRANNPEKSKEYSRQYRVKNAEICRQRNRECWKKYSLKYNLKKREYIKENPQIARTAFHKRRSLMAKASLNLKGIKEFMARVYAKRFIKCYYCNQTVSTKKIHFDHIIALSKGGSHSVDNLCVSCVSCNCRKWTKPINEWIRLGQQILPL